MVVLHGRHGTRSSEDALPSHKLLTRVCHLMLIGTMTAYLKSYFVGTVELEKPALYLNLLINR